MELNPTSFGASASGSAVQQNDVNVKNMATNDPFYVARDEVSQALEDVNDLVTEYLLIFSFYTIIEYHLNSMPCCILFG